MKSLLATGLKSPTSVIRHLLLIFWIGVSLLAMYACKNQFLPIHTYYEWPVYYIIHARN